MNFWLFGLFYLIYTLFLIIIGVLLLKKFGKNLIHRFMEDKLEKYFDDYEKEQPVESTSVEELFNEVGDIIIKGFNEITEESDKIEEVHFDN